MCGRFTLEPTEEFYEWFQLDHRLESLRPRYNIAPGQMVPVVVADSTHHLVLMRWGLIPRWAKDAKIGYKMINARMETLTEKLAFRGLLRAQRCLVPASGFYEWKAEERAKTPYYIHPTGARFFAFAGLYDVWTNPEGQEIASFTIITKAADGVVARLHRRMPVILERELEDDWLDPTITDVKTILAILEQSSGIPLATYPVSRMVNTASMDTHALIEPVVYASHRGKP
jgi:putative SOS response-associated peptidase YedK